MRWRKRKRRERKRMKNNEPSRILRRHYKELFVPRLVDASYIALTVDSSSMCIRNWKQIQQFFYNRNRILWECIAETVNICPLISSSSNFINKTNVHYTNYSVHFVDIINWNFLQSNVFVIWRVLKTMKQEWKCIKS